MRAQLFVACTVLVGCGRIGFDESAASLGCPQDLQANAPYAGGAGTSDDPFQLCTPTQLIELSTRPTDLGAHFVLMSDVDLAGVAFPGIGSTTEPFTGWFDGNGYKIANVEITAPAGQPAGFVNVAKLARIDNLHLAGVTVAGATDVGAVVGSCELSQVRNATVDAAVVRGDDSVGGLVGEAMECQFLDATLAGTVEGSVDSVGGLVGLAGNSAFLDITSTARVDAPLATAVGGAVGTDGWFPVILQNVTITSDVVGNKEVGGIVGMNGDGSLIYRTRFDGTVRGNVAVGGIVGAAYDSPFEVYSTSSRATVTGNDGVGGFAGYHYYRTRFFDSYFTGTLVGVGAAQRAFGGFFGDVEYYGWAERSYVDVTIDSQASTAGGFMGHIGYWSASSDTYDIARSFAAAHVTGSSPTATISPWVGQNEDPNPLVGAGSYYWSGGGCTNLGGGGCATGGMAVADLTELQGPSAPLAAWDFAGIWQATPGAFPTLRLAQLAAPVQSGACPTVAIAGLHYACTLAVTDGDPNEIQLAALERPHTCRWLSSDRLTVSGTPMPADGDSCTLAFSVTDGPHTTPVETVAIAVHAGVVLTPATSTGTGFSFGFSAVGSAPVTQLLTVTNREATTVTGLAITGLPASDFAFAGGAYPGTGGTCTTTLDPGATCTVAIDYTATIAGSISQPIDVHFTAARGPVTYAFTLTGYGT